MIFIMMSADTTLSVVVLFLAARLLIQIQGSTSQRQKVTA